MVTRLSE